MVKAVPYKDRFWTKVDIRGQDDCWPWTAYSQRYGRIGIHGSKSGLSHRIAWELTNGSIPDGMRVLHRCDNPLCCNPAHLFLGTQLDNIMDMVAKGRRRGGGIGERCGSAKLKAHQVLEIRARYAAGGISQQKLGDIYGVVQTVISCLLRGKTWRSVKAAIVAIPISTTPILVDAPPEQSGHDLNHALCMTKPDAEARACLMRVDAALYGITSERKP